MREKTALAKQLERLQEDGRTVELRRGALLIRRGETRGCLYIVVEGLIKAYYETLQGRQFIKSFVREGGFIASMRSVVAHEPSEFAAVCLENTRAIEIPRATLDARLAEDPGCARALNAMLLALAAKKEQREYELLCLSAEERYARLVEQEPDLLDRLSQKDTALYLGISPISLCRIHKRIRQRDGSAEPSRRSSVRGSGP